jgi:tetratricopeptide (TPR) repeat protein
VPAVAALGLILAYVAATSRYLPYWESGVKLFTQARMVAGQPNYVIEEHLADAMVSAGRFDEAFPHYREACVLHPNDALCHSNMATILFSRHQLQDALEEYKLAGSLTASKDMAVLCLINSGQILLKLGDYETAETKFAAALQIDPNNNTALLLRQRVFNQKSSKNR